MGSIRLTVFFEGPFWVGVVERRRGSELEVARHVFGPEPSAPEVLAFVATELARMRFGPAVEAPSVERRRSPKRAAREAQRELARRGGTSRADDAIRLALEVRAKERRADRRCEREEARERAWALRVEKRKRRHRGH